MTTETITMPISVFAQLVFTDMAHDAIATLRARPEGIDEAAVKAVLNTAYAGEDGYAMEFLYDLIISHPFIEGGGALLWWKVDILEWLYPVLTGDKLPVDRIGRHDDRELGGVVKNPPYYYEFCMETQTT